MPTIIGLLKEQDYRCAICGSADPDRAGTNKNFCIDHRHIDGFDKLPPEEKRKYIRGLLCHSCNYGLGYLDSANKCENAARYLSERGE